MVNQSNIVKKWDIYVCKILKLACAYAAELRKI